MILLRAEKWLKHPLSCVIKAVHRYSRVAALDLAEQIMLHLASTYWISQNLVFEKGQVFMRDAFLWELSKIGAARFAGSKDSHGIYRKVLNGL